MADDLEERRAAWGSRWNTKEDWDRQGEAIASLREGDALPLARLLRSGEPLTRSTSEELADMIEGQGLFFNVELKHSRQDRRSWTEVTDKDRERMVVGVFFEGRVRELRRGGYESALVETLDRFGCKKAHADKCRKLVRDLLARIDEEWRDEAWRRWQSSWAAV